MTCELTATPFGRCDTKVARCEQNASGWFRLSAVLAVCGLYASLLTSSARSEDWPRWGGPRGNETWQAPAAIEAFPQDGLPVVWKQKIGGGYSGLSVAAGQLFLHDYIKTPEEQERITCYQAVTGKQLWQHVDPVSYKGLDYGTGPRGTPTVFEGRVYTLGAVGRACCLDAKTGDVVWSIDFVADWGAKLPTWGLAASPVIVGDLVILHPGVPNGGCFVALDRHTGKKVWQAGNDPAGYCTPSLIEAPSGPMLLAWSPLHVLGLEPKTGELLWQIPYKVTYGVSIAAPVYRDGIACVMGYWEGSKAIRLGEQKSDAKLLWEENRNLRGLMSQPIERDGFVYGLDKQYGVTCFELATGTKRWDDGNQLTARGRNPQLSLTWLAGTDRVLSLNAEGELLLLRFTPERFEELGRTKMIDPPATTPIWAHPAFSGRLVYARSDEELICRRLLPE